MLNVGKSLITYDPGKKKYVACGKIIGDTLFRSVSSRHFMRVMQGYGIQEVAFQEIMEKKLNYIVLKEEETGKSWKATIEMWKTHGRVADYGNGKQRFLSLKFMDNYKEREVPEIQKTVQTELFT